MAIITLTTDFGTLDGYPGVMKGVILNIAPNAKIVDLSHEISPQDIMEAALLLWRSVPYFPDGTIHVAVVDPGVGTTRRAIAAQIGRQYFVGPDNGIFSLVMDTAVSNGQLIWIGELNKSAFWLPVVSSTFHGRDIFAPVAAHLASGISIKQLSTQINDPVRLELPPPIKSADGWIGQVIHIDHFGNLSTNIDGSTLRNIKLVTIEIKGKLIDGLIASFADRLDGALVALIDSSGLLAISVVNGNAAQHIGSSIGDSVFVHIKHTSD
jgi:hypothetical protein